MIFLLLLVSAATSSYSQLWLSYRATSIPFRASFHVDTISCNNASHSVLSSACQELSDGLAGMLGKRPSMSSSATKDSIVLKVEGTSDREWPPLPGNSAFAVKKSKDNVITVTSPSTQGILYGTFRLLNLIRRESAVLLKEGTVVASIPQLPLRMWDLWDNLDGSVERGYAGPWEQRWDTAPPGASEIYPLSMDKTSTYRDVARLLASVGINVIVWDNVNACAHGNQDILSTQNIAALAPLAAIFHSFGVFSMLTPCFDSPHLVGHLKNSDPHQAEVTAWWNTTITSVASTWAAGSFRGFLFKGDTEGQPGPNMFHMTELEGANYFGQLLQPVDAVVIWRAFAHPPKKAEDQALYQFERFVGWNGKTLKNVILQTKNGPYDFQVREPIHSLFGALPDTNLIVEFEATQEYLGQARHVSVLIPQWRYYLNYNLGAPPLTSGKSYTLGELVAGGPNKMPFSGAAAVGNLGSNSNRTGHVLAAANTYGYGRITWDTTMDSGDIEREWAEATFANSSNRAIDAIVDIVATSWLAYENYTSSLGWGFSCASNHYDMDMPHRKDYHNASKTHIGYNRGLAKGFASTYNGEVAQDLLSVDKCPEELLLSFHNVPYTHVLKDTKYGGMTVLEWIYESHKTGAATAQSYVDAWTSIQHEVDMSSYPETSAADVLQRLSIGAMDAKTFADGIVAYFKKVTGVSK